jgi:hypothetical protein
MRLRALNKQAAPLLARVAGDGYEEASPAAPALDLGWTPRCYEINAVYPGR